METVELKETELSKWLKETKSLNLDFTSLKYRIGSSPSSKIYSLLDGKTSSEKARSLINRWRNEIGDDTHIPLIGTVKSKSTTGSKYTLRGTRPENHFYLEEPFIFTSNFGRSIIRDTASEGRLKSENDLEIPKTEIKKEVKSNLNDKCLIPEGTKLYYSNDPNVKYVLTIHKESPNRLYIDCIEYSIPEYQSRMTWRGKTIQQINKSLLDRELRIQDISKEDEIDLLGEWNNIVTNDKAISQHKGESEVGIYKCELNNSNRNYFIVTPGVTGNCQISAVAHANTILMYSSDIKKQFAEIFNFGRKIALVDINRRYVKSLKEHLDKYILSHTPYISTNGSEMDIFLIDVRNIYNELRKNEEK